MQHAVVGMSMLISATAACNPAPAWRGSRALGCNTSQLAQVCWARDGEHVAACFSNKVVAVLNVHA